MMLADFPLQIVFHYTIKCAQTPVKDQTKHAITVNDQESLAFRVVVALYFESLIPVCSFGS